MLVSNRIGYATSSKRSASNLDNNGKSFTCNKNRIESGKDLWGTADVANVPIQN